MTAVDGDTRLIRIARRRAKEERGNALSLPSDDEVGGQRARSAEQAIASAAIRNVVVLWAALVRLDASVDRSRYG
jgi:hypothetical protein